MHGNSGAYRASIFSVARPWDDSPMMLLWFCRRNVLRSWSDWVSVLSSALRLASCCTSVWFTTVKSLSACTMSGAAWL